MFYKKVVNHERKIPVDFFGHVVKGQDYSRPSPKIYYIEAEILLYEIDERINKKINKPEVTHFSKLNQHWTYLQSSTENSNN